MPVVKTITETELIGMRIAANSGDNVPCTAIDKPIILYKNDITKLIRIIFMLILAKCIKSGNLINVSALRIPSDAGENVFTSSEIVMPTSL